jgi:hypothetical protein
VTPAKVDQTIFATDPKRLGNCLAACVASALGLQLEQVPNFVEWGRVFGDVVDMHDPEACSGQGWWAMLMGFFAGQGVWPVVLDDPNEAEPGEVVFVVGKSVRGVMHQVLYRDGQLWHDPHPSRAGIIAPEPGADAWVLRPCSNHDHAPTEETR